MDNGRREMSAITAELFYKSAGQSYAFSKRNYSEANYPK